MTYRAILQAQLIADEGKRNLMYRDSRGIESIGIGHNLRDVPISDRAVQVIFEDDVADAEVGARRLLAKFDELTEARKAVVVNMVFNLGFEGFKKFSRTRGFIDHGMYDAAADGILESTFAEQVGQRAVRLADAMRTGYAPTVSPAPVEPAAVPQTTVMRDQT